ncbi:porin family protein [Vibrio genomosp. F6]|uniref:outer membrane beta-barrel protein n=1 Tax=Vibrio genomosp. F6 TaxID=723172 RepID=UPI0010BD4A2F|nr:outer membrane beta-barrel protein [Vibrio genomosp. F6]TKF21071.1 porin family protein [Vibrio genomosp. F6]
MKRPLILIFTTMVCLPTMANAAGNRGSLYTNVGATLVSNDSNQETAYFIQAGYNYQMTKLLSADVSYKRVETFNSSVSANSDDFVQTYDAYGLGVRVDQQVGLLGIYGKAGGSYISSETTVWDTVAGAKKTETDDSFKPYASAGVSLMSPIGLVLDAGVTYQLLPNDEHATSFNAGARFAF